MKSDEFLKEIKESNLYLKDFEKVYKEFRFFQNLVLETFNEFHRICEKNKISYQLAYGSLLGAIRDNGQIPWDYDIDVFISFYEKDKLISALKKDLSKEFYFYCPETDKKCRHFSIRLAPQKYKTEVLHVDVFYLIGTPNDLQERKIFINKIKSLSSKRYQKLVKFKDENRSLKALIIKFINKIKLLNYNPDIDYKKYLELCSLYTLENSDIITTADVYSDWYEFSYNMLKETRLIKTNVGELRIPINYDKILKIIYGDYHRLMPLNKRIKELLQHYNALKKYALKKDEK